MNLRRYFGDKDFYKHTLHIAVPLMLQQLVSTSVNLLDNLMIGQLGDHALAGVATVNRYFMIAIFGTLGIIAASTVFLAQFYGSNDENHMKQTYRFSIISTSMIMSFFIVLALAFPSKIVGFFVDDSNVILEGSRYIVIAALSFIPTMFTMAIAGSMRAVGDSKSPLIASLISMVTNLFFNYALIYGHFGFPTMGIVGAGIGTLIARIVEIIVIILFLRRNDYPFKTPITTLFQISPTLVKAISLKALPLALNEVLYAGGMAMLMKFYGTRGADAISGYSISLTVSDLFFTMNAGMSVATTILVSQPLGANKKEEAKNNAYKLMGFGFMMAICFGILLFISSFYVPNLYDVSDNALFIAKRFLQIMSVLFWIYILNTSIYFILRAGGDMKSTLLLDSTYMWTINLTSVGLATYFTDLSIMGLYTIGQITDIVKLLIAFYFVKQERWLVNLAEKEQQQELIDQLIEPNNLDLKS